MPLYNTSAFAPLPEVAIPAKPAYFFGNLPVDTQDTQARITNLALTSNVATITATIYQGNIPVVGNLISVLGASNSAFNVSAAAITVITGTPSTGVYQISYAVTHADIATGAGSGMAIVPIAETSEALANGTSVAIYIPSNELRDLGQRSVTVATTFPSLPTAAVVTLYTAIDNSDNPVEWTSMGAVATVVGGSVTVPTGSSPNGGVATFSTPAGRFVRLVVSGASGGTSPTVIAKMIC